MINKYPKIISLFLLLLSGSSLSAQSPYKLFDGKDGIILGVSGGILAGGFLIDDKVKAIEKQEWAALNRNDVFSFDRPATFNWSKKAQKTSDILLYSSIVMPLSMAISRNSHEELGAVGLFTLETAAITVGLTNLTKNLTERNRPYLYNHEGAPWEVVRKQNLKDARRSFFSGHTSTTTAMYFMSAKMYSDFHPNSDFKTVAWIGAAAVPALTGWLRVKGGKHYYTDVITGFAVGALVGILVPELHK